jgi:glycine dehydrogenase subunit 2
LSKPVITAEIPRFYREEPSLFDLSRQTAGEELPWAETNLPKEILREKMDYFPDVNEVEVVRHYTRLSQRNFGMDEGLYPLGSCTMKHNPKINEAVAALKGFTELHPAQRDGLAQGALELLYNLQNCLGRITGMDAVSLQGAAGAQGEFVGLKTIVAYHKSRGENRTKVLIPDSAHGTNPASSALCGLEVVPLISSSSGTISAEQVAKVMDGSVAALMTTIPNTLGIFGGEIEKIAEVVHSKGGLIYGDGANLNALMCRVNMKKLGVDTMHMNLHKTFSTPHGGGGPGAGPVACIDKLEPFLPTPKVEYQNGKYSMVERGPQSIGRVKPFYGSFAVLVRAYAYILAHGGQGLRDVSGNAVLNANYLRKKLEPFFDLPYQGKTLHEVVFSDKRQQANGVSTMDMAKRLMDFGFHPPTVYFPLIVKGALMIEPTETVSKLEMDRFVAAMRQIAEEAKNNPEKVTSAPHHLTVGRFDEVRAARKPELTWHPTWQANSEKR